MAESFDALLAAVASVTEQAGPSIQASLGFDEIVAEFSAITPAATTVDRSLDWSHAVLKLAADEMRLAVRGDPSFVPRDEPQYHESQHDDRQHIAA